MKVAVLGAGVVGVASAWYLAKAGHEVTVIERQPGAGLECSFANGGQISPCHSEPWANPDTPSKILRWMGHEDAPLVFRWARWDPALWLWGMRFIANCTPGRTRLNTERALRLALYARGCLQALRAETGIAYDERLEGILHIYRDRHEFDHACRAARQMDHLGLERIVKTPAEAVAIEPALAPHEAGLAGAIYTPGDESGDAHLFTRRLAELCAARGVVFRYGSEIHGLEMDKGLISGVATTTGRVRADAFVLALASMSPKLAGQVGLRLPVYPAKGYSITLPIGKGGEAPTVSITDDEQKIVYSRLGERLRCAGTAEMAGWDASLTKARAEAILKRAKAMFPKAGDYAEAELWAGLRPATPDSVPILGKSPIANLYLNTGHGTLGWTMASGSGRVLADVIDGKPPDIDLEGLGLERFRLSL